MLPIPAELVLQEQHPSRWPLFVAIYLVALAIYLVLAPTSPSVITGAAPVAVPYRAKWMYVSLAIVVLGFAMAMRNPRQLALVPIWLAGVGTWLFAWFPTLRLPRISLRELWLPLLLMVPTALMRLYRLDWNPYLVDEGILTERIQRHLYDSPFGLNGIPYFQQLPWEGPSQVWLSIYARMPPYWVAGIDMWTLRLISALEGIAEVFLVYLVARVMFGTRAGLVALTTLSTLTIHIAFSRYSGLPMDGTFVVTAAMLPLAMGFARRSAAWMGVSGIVLAQILSVYASARVGLAMAIVMLVLAPLDPRLRGRWLLNGSLALVGGFAVGMGPLLAAFYQYPSTFIFQSEYAGWLPGAIAAFRATGDLNELLPIWDHLWRAVLGYNLLGPRDYNYKTLKPFFYAVPAALLFCGVMVASLKLKDWRHSMLGLWFWGPTIGLSFLSPHPPEGHRALAAFVASSILIGYAFDRIVWSWEQVGSFFKRIALPIATLGLGAYLVLEAAFYFTDFGYSDLSPWENQYVRYVLSTPVGRHLSIIDRPDSQRLPTFFATDLGRHNGYDIINQPIGQLVQTRHRPMGVSYLMIAHRGQWLPIVKSIYPESRVYELRSLDPRTIDPGFHFNNPMRDMLMWTAVEVPPTELPRHQGLDLTLTDSSGKGVTVRTTALRMPDSMPPDLTYPVSAEWRGWFRADRRDGEPNQFVSLGTVKPSLRLGDQEIDVGDSRVRFEHLGGHALYASARLRSPADTVHVQWNGRLVRDLSEIHETVVARGGPRDPGFRDFPVEQAVTWPGPPRVTLDWTSVDGLTQIRRDYDAVMSDHTLGERAPQNGRPSIVRMTGHVDVQRGSYDFRVIGDGPARLFIDDRQIWPVTGTPIDGDMARSRLWLEPGRHKIGLERSLQSGGGQVELVWRPPGHEKFTIIPPEVYVPLEWPPS